MKNLFENKSWDTLTVDEAIAIDMEIFKHIKAFRLMNVESRFDVVSSIVERLNLEQFFVFYNNMCSSHNLPYHNQYHTHCMILNCYEGAEFEKLTINEARGLCTAAMYHDFNHAGGKLEDEENINLALTAFFIGQKYANANFLGLTEEQIQVAINAIKITQYPFLSEPVTITEKIIRDADLMQCYEENDEVLRAQFLGLKQEVEIRNPPMTNEEFSDAHMKWQNENVVWYTNWGRTKSLVLDFNSRKTYLNRLLKS